MNDFEFGKRFLGVILGTIIGAIIGVAVAMFVISHFC